jgi:hypothetical protein
MILRSSPFFSVWFDRNPADYTTGCYKFRDLLIKLTQFSPETADWRVFTTPDATSNSDGLDPLTQMDEVIAFFRSRDLDGSSQMAPMIISAAYYRNFANDRRIRYLWNRRSSPDNMEFEIEDIRYIAPVTIPHYIALADILLTWQRPRYMWLGDPWYARKGHGLFHGHRTVANWIAWVPQSVTPTQIPSAHIVRPHLGGTLIVTQPDFFNARDNQPAIDRANAVASEMNEAGVLPLLSDLV